MRKLFISFISLVLLVMAGSASAETVYYAYSNKSGETKQGFGSTALAACVALAGFHGYPTPTNASGGSCWNPQTGQAFGGYSTTTRTDCPSGQVRQGDGSCGAPPLDCSSKLPIVRRFDYAKGVAAVPPKSYGGCAVTADEMLVCRKTSAGSYCMWQVSRTGAAATDTPAAGSGAVGSDTPASAADPTTNSPALPSDEKGNCPAGSVQAGVGSDGIPICIGTGTKPGAATTPAPTSNTTKATDAAGNTVETTKTTSTNSDGSTTTTTVTTTTAPDGTKSVTGTTTTGAASNGSQGQRDPEATEFCKVHPELNICRNSSVAGSCGQVACVGDAIQCATLRAAAAMQCAQDADTKALQASASKTLGDSILAGSDPQKASIDAMVKGTEVDLSKPALDQSGFIGGGSCIPAKTFTVMGKAVSVDFSRLCSDIQPLRAVIMAVAFIAAYMIVSRSVLSA